MMSILLVVSWTGKMNISLSPFAPENLAPRDEFDGYHVSLPFSKAESVAHSRDSSLFPLHQLI